MKIEEKLYFAYGSNMNLDQMAYRCPAAEAVCTAKLEGYELFFAGRPGNGVASIRPKQGGTVVGVLFVKALNLFMPRKKINPMIGAAGISAFPMSARVIEKLGQEADHRNHLLMQATGANVSGQIASVVAGGVVLQYCAAHMIGG